MKQKLENLVVWGDSILKGIVENYNGKKYDVIPNNGLFEASKKLNINVINHCYFGCTINKGVSVITRDLTRNISCDAAIVEFGGNDCDFSWKEIARSPEEEHKPATPLALFKNKLSDIIKLLRNKNIMPILMTLPPIVPEKYFNTITNGLDSSVILNWLGDKFYLYRWHEMYSDAVMEIANKTDSFVIDMRSYFLAEKNYQKYICNDGIHPNESGHKFMESVFVEAATNAKHELLIA